MPSRKKKAASINVILSKLGKNGYHLFLPIYINGKKCRFLIDTGASKSVIDKGYFEQHLGKEKLKVVQQQTAGLHSSTPESHFGDIKEIKIGEHKIAGYELAAIDLTHVNTTYLRLKKPKIQGILGSDIMLKYKIVLDYGNLSVVIP